MKVEIEINKQVMMNLIILAYPKDTFYHLSLCTNEEIKKKCIDILESKIGLIRKITTDTVEKQLSVFISARELLNVDECRRADDENQT